MATRPHTLKLINDPAGFDVFKVSQQGVQMPFTSADILVEGEKIRLIRQEQFEGSSELIYEIDGIRQPAEETGGADTREDEVVHCPGDAVDYRLQTNCTCKPKK